jgi:hypothetical protein
MLCGVNEASQCYFLLAVYVSRSSEAKERLPLYSIKKQATAGSVQYRLLEITIHKVHKYVNG